MHEKYYCPKLDILYSFAGEDEQTRAQIAYACIIKKINNSPSKENWLYLLKNLIILDRYFNSNILES